MNRPLSVIAFRIFTVLFTAATLFLTVDAYAQEDFWEKIGETYGGQIKAVAVNPGGDIFAADSNAGIDDPSGRGSYWS